MLNGHAINYIIFLDNHFLPDIAQMDAFKVNLGSVCEMKVFS